MIKLKIKLSFNFSNIDRLHGDFTEGPRRDVILRSGSSAGVQRRLCSGQSIP